MINRSELISHEINKRKIKETTQLKCTRIVCPSIQIDMIN